MGGTAVGRMRGGASRRQRPQRRPGWRELALQRELQALSRVADQVTREQRYDVRVPVDKAGEVGRLAQAFNSMLAAVATRDTELRRSQALVESIVDKSSAVIYIKDTDGRYLMVNRRFRELMGPGSPDPLGRRDADLFPPEAVDTISAGDRAVMDCGAAYTYEESVPDAAGVLHTYLSEKFCLRDERGEMWAIGGVSTDITERKKAELELIQYRDRLEEQVQLRIAQLQEANRELGASLETLQRAQDELVRSEKLAALGALVAGVAHELNTPIGNSLLAVSTLVDQTRVFRQACAEGVKRSELAGFVEDIGAGTEIVQRNLHRAVDLVASFKQVAVDRTSSQSRSFMLSDLVSEILLVLAPTFRKSGHAVRHDIAPDIEMHSFPGPLGQVLINLINNGLTHAFEQHGAGEIVVTARHAGPGQITLTVSDNGDGIAPEHLGRIYDPFFTTKLGRGGSGLGLNIVYNIVYGVLRGRIEVDSAVGTGTRFVLTLPLSS